MAEGTGTELRDLIPGVIAVAAFVLLVVFLAGMRIWTKGRFSLESREIVAAVVAVGLGLFVFGVVTEITFGDVRIVRAVRDAASASVSVDQLALQFEPSEVEAKGASGLIPALIENETSALSFQLGSDRYVPSVVMRYLEELTKEPYLRFLVFNDQVGRLVGVADARAVAEEFRQSEAVLDAKALTAWINGSDIEQLRGLPDFVDGGEALLANVSTRDALSVMLKRNAERLPVVDETGRFLGIAYRAQLVSTILIALSDAS